jgi:hypothetical protein
MRRLLLRRVPFHRDQLAFKAVWYREHRRQLNQPEPDEAERDEQGFEPEEILDEPEAIDVEPGEFGVSIDEELIAPPLPEAEKWVPRRPVRLVLPPGEWAQACRTIIQDVMQLFPQWNEPYASQVNYRVIEFLKELKFVCPVSTEQDDVPLEYQDRLDQWKRECDGFQAVWYQECAGLMGFQLRTPRVARPELPPVPKKLPKSNAKPAKKDPQRMLF